MNKTLLIFTLPSLLTACIEPDPMLGGGPDEEPSTTGDASGSEESGGIEGESGETGEDVPLCDLETHACISNVPDGWAGPIARTIADPAVACRGDFGTVSIETYDEIVHTPAICTCECGTPSGGDCDDELVFELYPIGEVFGAIVNAMDCEYMYGDENQYIEAGDNWPYPEIAAENSARIIAHPPVVTSPGGCTPSVDTDEFPEPPRTLVRQACEPSEPLRSCDSDTICVPKAEEPFEGGVCIWIEGDVECPAGTDYATREVRHRGIVDTRACSECGCGIANGQSCASADVIMWRTSGDQTSSNADGACHYAGLDAGDEWYVITYEPGEPSGGSCVAEGNEAQGELLPETTITFCCA